MINRLKDIYNALRGRVKIQEVKVPSLIPYDVIRHQLGSIDRETVQYLKKMTDEEYGEHISNIDKIVSNPAFSAEIDGLIDAQAYWIAEKANESQLAFGRGTINGLSLTKERFQALSGEHRKRVQPKEKINPYDVVDKF